MATPKTDENITIPKPPPGITKRNNPLWYETWCRLWGTGILNENQNYLQVKMLCDDYLLYVRAMNELHETPFVAVHNDGGNVGVSPLFKVKESLTKSISQLHKDLSLTPEGRQKIETTETALNFVMNELISGVQS